MQKIGQGSFSTAWLLNESTVLIHSVDYVKECASYGWVPESRLFPEIERIEDPSDQTNLRAYTMEYFPKVKSLKDNLEPREWLLYQTLRKISVPYCEKDHDLSDRLISQFEGIPDEFEIERESLLEMIDSLANYGSDACFEISPRNVSCKNGKLILLDCFFMKSQLIESRKNSNYRKGL